MDLGESAQLPDGTADPAGLGGDVDLDDMLARVPSGVGDRDPGDGRVWTGDLDLERGGLERRVGQAVPERVAHGDASTGVVAVADHDALAVADGTLLAGEVDPARVVLEAQGHGLGQMPRGVHDAEQDVGDGGAAALAQQEALDDGVDLVVPTFHRHDAAV